MELCTHTNRIPAGKLNRSDLKAASLIPEDSWPGLLSGPWATQQLKQPHSAPAP